MFYGLVVVVSFLIPNVLFYVNLLVKQSDCKVLVKQPLLESLLSFSKSGKSIMMLCRN